MSVLYCAKCDRFVDTDWVDGCYRADDECEIFPSEPEEQPLLHSGDST